MYVNDPVADMLTRIRNAHMAGKAEVAIPYSKLKGEVARVLKDEGYLEDYAVGNESPFKWMTIQLKYTGVTRNRRPLIRGIKRISKPGRRIYTKCDDIPWVLSGMGIAILTTPKGVMTGQQARRERVGGEILAYVW